jgi:hypothetical protein
VGFFKCPAMKISCRSIPGSPEGRDNEIDIRLNFSPDANKMNKFVLCLADVIKTLFFYLGGLNLPIYLPSAFPEAK